MVTVPLMDRTPPAAAMRAKLILHFKEYEGDYSKEHQLVLSKITLVDPHLNLAYMPIIATFIIHFSFWV